jgi:hypothetical protein
MTVRIEACSVTSVAMVDLLLQVNAKAIWHGVT